MLKYTKFIGLVGLVLAMAILAAACERGSGNGNASPADPADAKEKPKNVTLRFSWFGTEARHKAVLEAIDLYKKQNPHVTIEPEYSGFDGYYQKLVTQFSGGTAPDIANLGITWLDDIAVKGDLVLDLYQVKDHLNLQAFDQNYLNSYTVKNGKLVALPMGVNGMVLVYNPKFYERFGIPQNTVWDWEKINQYGKKVHEQDPNAYLLSNLTVREFLHPYVKQKTGGQWIKDDKTLGFDEAVLTEAFAYFKKQIDDGVVQPLAVSSLYGDPSANLEWQQGKIGLVFELASAITGLKQFFADLDVTTYPIPADAKTPAVQVNPTTPIVINKASKHPEEAAKFISWLLTSEEAAAKLGVNFSVPPVKANAEKLTASGQIDPVIAKAVDLALARPGEPENGISGNQELFKLTEDYLQKVGYGQLAPAEAARELIRRMNEKLKEIK